MWAIAKQTLKAAVRYRLVFVLAITLLIIVFGLPLIVKSDGTAKGLVQLVLTYTLGATTALLGLASLWMGCGTLAREIEDNVMQMVAVKPITRWQIWFGKWIGIMLLNASLLVPTGFAIYFLIEASAPELKEGEQDKLRNEVLVSRSAVTIPEPDFTLNRGRAYAYSKLLALGKTDTQFTTEEQKLRMSVSNPEHILAMLYGGDYIQSIEKASNSNKPEEELIREIEELENQALGVARRSEEIILPGQPKRWEFQIDPDMVERVNKRPIYLRYRFSAGDEYDPKSHICTWRVGYGTGKEWPTNGEPKQLTIGSSVFHEMELSVKGGVVPKTGQVVVEFLNLNDKPIKFELKDGPSILYHDGGFGLNLARGLMIIFFWLGLISAIGLMASSFLSFPVAAFMSIGILLISASTGTLEQIIEEEGISGVNHETGRKDRSTMVDNLAINMSKVLLRVTDLVWGYSPVENLSSGKTITWNSLLIAFVGIILIMAGIISAFGAFMFHRKELALPNPTASMN